MDMTNNPDDIKNTDILYNKLMRLIRMSQYPIATSLAALTFCEHEIMQEFKNQIQTHFDGDPHATEIVEPDEDNYQEDDDEQEAVN